MKFILQNKRYRLYCLAIFGLILSLIIFIPSRLAIAKIYAPHPQAIFTLGGDLSREIFTAQFAKLHPNLEVWISSGSPDDATNWAFGIIGLSSARVHNDRRAVDTLTNFTSLVADFKKRHFQHLYLITADYHMRRAKAIAVLIFGSQGITFTPVSIPTHKPVESWLPLLRDVGRALLWLFTGHTGASLDR
jgi:uncharacterized SAM-binding protein YcdF (DUF218 family)